MSSPKCTLILASPSDRLAARPQVLIGDSGAPGAQRAGEAACGRARGAAGAWLPETLDKGLLDMLFLTC